MSKATTPKAIFTIGGPGSGKSFVLGRDFGEVYVVDCDAHKEAHPDYDPTDPMALHEWSRIEMTKDFFRCLGGNESFAYDGTGANAERLVEWMLKASEVGFEVVLLYVTCSLQTALERNQKRTRTVPEGLVRE